MSKLPTKILTVIAAAGALGACVTTVDTDARIAKLEQNLATTTHIAQQARNDARIAKTDAQAALMLLEDK